MDVRRRLTAGWRRWRTGRQRRRVVYYLVGLTTAIVVYTLVYRAGMAVFEGQQVSFAKALLAVTQSFTTTGYGEDAALWTTAPMQLLAVAMQLTGVSLIFLALPVFLAPWVEEVLATTTPTAATDFEDHVVVCGYTSRGETLIEELRERDLPYVVVEPDRDRAADVYESEPNVVHADPETVDGLRRANVGAARALVADVDDETNATIVLTARQIDDVEVVTFVEDPSIADYHRYAGADTVFSPRQLLGERLARKVTASATHELDDATAIGDDFELVELPVQADCELDGVTVAESGIRERTGVNVIGAWFRGEFESPPSPGARIDAGTVLLAAGREERLERLKGLTRSEHRERDPGTVVVAGHGEVGSTVAAELDRAGVDCVVIDREPAARVDVVGDVTDVETLEAAGVDEAGTAVLALPDDTATVFAALVLREVAPGIEILARSDATESVRKLYHAGTDYVLALATVSGRMLASTILDEEVIAFGQQIELVRTAAGSLAGRSLAGADVRARTGCTVVAVERDGATVDELDPEFVVREGDRLLVAGTDADTSRFVALVES